MKNILELESDEAKSYFLKQESYSSIELPYYFNFQNLLEKVSNIISGHRLSDFKQENPRDFENVNYQLVSNKDGKYAWRPFQLINPAIYVSLINNICNEENWNFIKKRFEKFQQEDRIECHSLPIISESEEKSDKSAQILNWWKTVEQRSIKLALDFQFVMHSDITDCYGSIYTHSISWALHTKKEAKKRENRNNKSFIGVVIDNHLQDMCYGQTNGIPQGSTLMDFISEIVLGYVDLKLANKLSKLNIKEYKILRYRDDYRIFTNDSFEAEQLTKELAEILSNLGLRLNAAKTNASDDIVKSSIKPDKRYWINNRRIAENKQKWLIQLYLLSEKFPNSGTIDNQMRDFLKVLEKSKKKDHSLETLISLVTEIALRNPRVTPSAIAILSIFINRLPNKKDKLKIANKIKAKFNQKPNSSYMMVWFQRLYLKINKKEEYKIAICRKINESKEEIWNCTWLGSKLKEVIEQTNIVEISKVKKARTKMFAEEIKNITTKDSYYN
jgi:hypothetical protein